jgi:alpha-tubulin suppressor-like RCC1 family protein
VVRANFDTACATRTDGSLWCWGNNSTGQLADGTTTHRYAPTRIGAATTWTSDYAPGYHVCAARGDDSLWCWGNNANGQLGDGTTTQRPAPIPVTLPA